MAVQNVQSHLSGIGLGQAPEPAKKEFGEQEFLKLLMTQLANQDPMNPMESAEFMDQLTAMNTVEQLMTANERLNSLMMGLSSLNNQSSVGLVGKTIVARGDTVRHEEGSMTELKFELAEPVAEADITIKDSSGQVVDVVPLSDIETGIQSIEWDGIATDGPASSGDYTFEVRAYNEYGDPVEARTYVTGMVDEVRFDQGYPMLVIGGEQVGLDAILRIVNDGELLGEGLTGDGDVPVLGSEGGEGDPLAASLPGAPTAAETAVAQAYSENPFGT